MPELVIKREYDAVNLLLRFPDEEYCCIAGEKHKTLDIVKYIADHVSKKSITACLPNTKDDFGEFCWNITRI
jgi:hypothetical protein